MSVLHVVQYSLPDIVSGYTIRTRAIVRQQLADGLDPIVVSSPSHPVGSDCELDGIRHYRSGPEPGGSVWRRDLSRVRALASRICEIASSEGNLKLLHAHSPLLCGLAALRAARQLKLPVVYEVRGLWEQAMLQGAPWRRWLPRYRLARRLETQLCRRAQAVVTISDGLRREFLARGISEDKLHVVTNGVDTRVFAPPSPARDWRSQRNLPGGPVALYLGALRAYEGVGLLIEALPRIRQRVPDAQVVIVGAGEHTQRLAEQARRIGGGVTILPPVPHEDTPPLYAAADVVAYPRVSTRATELVTPLKPLESMAMGKAIAASDVGGLRELLSDGETARLFAAGSVDSLADVVASLLGDPAERQRIGEAANRVARERYDWRRVVQRYEVVYETAGARNTGK